MAAYPRWRPIKDGGLSKMAVKNPKIRVQHFINIPNIQHQGPGHYLEQCLMFKRLYGYLIWCPIQDSGQRISRTLKIKFSDFKTVKIGIRM